MQDQQPLKIFIVYAHEDAEALKELRVQFIPVARSERLEVWYDGEILPGQHWDKEIKTQLRSADIILLFISKYFFASEYIQSTELKEALERHEAGKSVVVPVIVRPCVWQDDFDVSKFQALPANAHPIFSSLWRDPDEAMVSVVEGIKKVARNLRAGRERLELIEKQKLEAEKAEKEREATERLARIAREQRESEEIARREREKTQKEKETARFAVIEAEKQHLAAIEAEKHRKAEEEKRKAAEVEAARLAAIETKKRRKAEEEKRRHTNGYTFRDAPNLPEMVFVEGGTFQMGSNDEDDEKPIHTVTLREFSIGKYPVTFEEYDRFCADTNRKKPADEGWGRGKRPVINVSHDDAKAYCDWLSKHTDKKYQLPTEAQWEFAARGGTLSKNYKFAGSNNLDEVGWFRKNSGAQTHPVCEKLPNELGLHDMSGNVWEWCGDWYAPFSYSIHPAKNPTGVSSDYSGSRVIRGGSWNFDAYGCRVTNRSNHSFFCSIGKRNKGFRLCRQ